MKVVVCLIIVASCIMASFGMSGYIFYGTDDEKDAYMEETQMDGTMVSPVLENAIYDYNEVIEIKFIVKASSDVAECTTDGKNFLYADYVVTQLGKTVFTTIEFYDNLESLTYVLNVHLQDDDIITAYLYAITTEQGIFLSALSADDAKLKYREYLIQNEIISEKEYEDISINECRIGVEEDVQYAKIRTRSKNSSVQGTLWWRDDRDIAHPLQFVKVQVVFYLFGFIVSTMGETYTNENGNYSITFNSVLTDDLAVFIYPAGLSSKVIDASENDYIFKTARKIISPRTSSTYNATMTMATDLGRAFQISQAIVIAAKFAEYSCEADIPNVSVRYPFTTTSYSSSGNRINIEQATNVGDRRSYARWDSIMHEYGHHVQHALGISDSPGLGHNSTWNMAEHYSLHADPNFLIGCTCAGANNYLSDEDCYNKGVRIAYAEAWATVYGQLAQEKYIDWLPNIDTVAN